MGRSHFRNTKSQRPMVHAQAKRFSLFERTSGTALWPAVINGMRSLLRDPGTMPIQQILTHPDRPARRMPTTARYPAATPAPRALPPPASGAASRTPATGFPASIQVGQPLRTPIVPGSRTNLAHPPLAAPPFVRARSQDRRWPPPSDVTRHAPSTVRVPLFPVGGVMMRRVDPTRSGAATTRCRWSRPCAGSGARVARA